MQNKLVCTECPKGCILSVAVKHGTATKVTGYRCKKGKAYAYAETENPVRLLTSTVQARGLAAPMIPVRTDKPIPKKKITEAMAALRKIVITKPVTASEVLKRNFSKLSVRLSATRSIGKRERI